MNKAYPLEVRICLPNWVGHFAEIINLGYKMLGPILAVLCVINFNPMLAGALVFWLGFNFEVEVKNDG